MIIVQLVTVLISVAYLIVLERKGLGIAQLRMGPNKVAFKGLGQPIADGVKLFLKEIRYTHSTRFIMFVVGPVILFYFAYSLWVLFPSATYLVRLE